MGRRNKAYSKDLHQQVYEKLTGMQAFGESKKRAMEDGTYKDKIFSFSTYQTYWKGCKTFIKWIKEEHPNITTLKKAKGLVSEWLQSRVDYVDGKGNHLSAWTIQTEAAAVNKLFGIRPDDPNRFQPPKRRREDIKRSRGDAVRDKHFSLTNNDELIKFCKGTGLRRSGVESVKGRDLMTKEDIMTHIRRIEAIPEGKRTPADKTMLGICRDALLFKDQNYFIHVREKGGRERISPVISNIQQIVDRFRMTGPDQKVWQHVPKAADIHSFRSVYANRIYQMTARDIKDIPYDRINRGTGRHYQSEVYHCRKDEVGKKLDKRAMYLCSKALGHNRIEVVANNYLRGL